MDAGHVLGDAGSSGAVGSPDAAGRLTELLHQARTTLGLSVAFISRIDGDTQRLEAVDTTEPDHEIIHPGAEIPYSQSLCNAVMSGDLPPVVSDLTRHPLGMSLAIIQATGVRSYVTVPIRFSDGSLYGTFCACDTEVNLDLRDRDRVIVELLASAASIVLEPDAKDRQRRREIEGRMRPVLAASGPTIVLQPIVALADGERVGSEALSRFPADWGKAPDVCFEEAHSVGLGDEMEIAALRNAGDLLEQVGGHVSMNVSPSTLMTPAFSDLMAGMPLDRVLLELSEHDRVADYLALNNTLAPLREQGMRLAIDDVGAGFSSLRHILVTSPDVLKLDRGIVAGVADQTILSTLVGSLTAFAHSFGATVVAEGIETAEDATELRRLGVEYGQGWHYGRPGPPQALDAD